MRPGSLAPILLAAALLPPTGAAAQLRAATLNLTVTVIRRVEIDVTRATPAAAARAGGDRLVFIDGAPPSLVVELRGDRPPHRPGERGPDLAERSPRWDARGSPPVALTDGRERPAGRRGHRWRGGGRRS